MDNLLSQVNIGSTYGSPFGRTRGIADLVSIILFNAIALAGIILFILMVFGGIMMIVGAGSGNKDDIGKGQKALTAALVGFLIIFASYWIILIVEQIFGFSIFVPGV